MGGASNGGNQVGGSTAPWKGGQGQVGHGLGLGLGGGQNNGSVPVSGLAGHALPPLGVGNPPPLGGGGATNWKPQIGGGLSSPGVMPPGYQDPNDSPLHSDPLPQYRVDPVPPPPMPLHSDPLPQYRDQRGGGAAGGNMHPGGGDPRVPTNWMHGNPGTPPVGVNPNVPMPPQTGGPMPPPAQPDVQQHKYRQAMAMQDQSLPMRFQKQNNPRYQQPQGGPMPMRPRVLGL